MPADRVHTPYPNTPRPLTSRPNISCSPTSHLNTPRRSNLSGSLTPYSSTSRSSVPSSSTSRSQVYHEYFDTFLFNGSKAEDHRACKDVMNLALCTQSTVDSVTQHLSSVDEFSQSIRDTISNIAPAEELLENVRGSTTVLGLLGTVEAFAIRTAASSARVEQRISELITETRKTLALLQEDLMEFQKIKGNAEALRKHCCEEQDREVAKLGQAFVAYEEAISGVVVDIGEYCKER